MADKDQSQSETGEEMEVGLKLSSEEDHEEVNKTFAKTKLDLESGKEAQLTETQMAADEEKCHSIMSSCSKTMLTFTEQATLLRDVADISNSLTFQSHDHSPIKQTGENDNKLLEKHLQTPSLVIFQQMQNIFDDKLCVLQPCQSGYNKQFYEILDLSRAGQTAENVKEKLASIRQKQEFVRNLDKKLQDATMNGKAETIAKGEEFKTAKSHEATNQVQAYEFDKSEWGKLVETHESELQKTISKISSLLSDLDTSLLETNNE